MVDQREDACSSHSSLTTGCIMQLTQYNLGVVMPVWLQEKPLLDLTYKALDGLRTKAKHRVYVVPSRLRTEMISPDDLQNNIRLVSRDGTARLCYTSGIERSVAGCWNVGVEHAIADGADFIMIYANDVMLNADTINKLICFGEEHHEVALWSALNIRDGANPKGKYGDTADFCCFMIRPKTVVDHGKFDERFRPAYFEDNDYYGRIILGGGKCAHVYDAQVEHLGSQTIRNDPEAAHHVNYWFRINERRMLTKWVTPRVANSPEEVLSLYAKHPWNDTTKPLSWWDRD